MHVKGNNNIIYYHLIAPHNKISHLPAIYTAVSLYPSKAKMNIAKSALALALASSARAFTPAAPSTRAFTSFARTSSNFIGAHRTMSLSSSASATALNANVLKLTEPAKDLLPGVDVFIFDCDGVIWRVSFVLLAWANPLFYTFV